MYSAEKSLPAINSGFPAGSTHICGVFTTFLSPLLSSCETPRPNTLPLVLVFYRGWVWGGGGGVEEQRSEMQTAGGYNTVLYTLPLQREVS
jgi:hypothetical protein